MAEAKNPLDAMPDDFGGGGYDDIPENGAPPSENYLNDVRPDHVKAAIAAKQKAKPADEG
jgi:hypothetical protein